MNCYEKKNTDNNKVLAFQVIIIPIPILEEDEDIVVFSFYFNTVYLVVLMT